MLLFKSETIAVNVCVSSTFSTRTTDQSDRRAATTWGIASNTINFKISKEKDIFVVLFKDNLKHKRIQLLIFTFVFLIGNVKWLNNINCIQGNGGDRPC